MMFVNLVMCLSGLLFANKYKPQSMAVSAGIAIRFAVIWP